VIAAAPLPPSLPPPLQGREHALIRFARNRRHAAVNKTTLW
jgi:hypothetical protein